jgi:phage gp45-like
MPGIPTIPVPPIPIPTLPDPLPCCRRATVDGQAQLIIETAAGQRITLQDTPGSVLIQDTNGNTVRLDPTGITITSSAKVVVSSSTALEINAPVVTVNAAMTTFSGTIQAETVIANSVAAASYSPGAGNVW